MTDPEMVAALRAWAPRAPRDLGTAARRLARRITAVQSECLEPLGALARWRREIADGTRSAGQLDELWRAATWETMAFERERDGDRAGAIEALQRAAEQMLAHVAGAAADHASTRRAA